MPFAKNQHKRVNALIFLLVALIVLGSFRIIYIQLINAQRYTSQLSGVTARTSILKAPRGEILDCYGRKIAVNRDGYNIVFNSAYINRKTLNDLILTLCNYLKTENAQWNDVLPLGKEAPYGFENENNDAFLKKIGLAHYASAENAFDKLCETYNLQGYEKSDARIIMGVRFSMSEAAFSIANPYNFAEDVSAKIMQKISENGFLIDRKSVV